MIVDYFAWMNCSMKIFIGLCPPIEIVFNQPIIIQ